MAKALTVGRVIAGTALAAVAVGVLVAGAAGAAGVAPKASVAQRRASITSCTRPVVLRKAGIYTVRANVTATAGDCIDIAASKVTLRLKGHTLTGNGSGAGAGVRILARSPSGVRNVADVVQGPGTIENFGTGVDVFASSATVEQVRAGHNVGIGIHLFRSSKDSVYDNLTYFNGHYGVYLQKARDDALILNSSTSNGRYGIWLQSADRNRLGRNEANLNGIAGVFLGCSNSGALESTSASTCSGTNGNAIVRNGPLVANKLYGIAIASGSGHNDVKGNRVSGSGRYDLADGMPGCGTNLWSANLFTTANQKVSPTCIG